MVIYLPAQASDDAPLLDELTPREIVRELDKSVLGQADAKKAVAIALRNRIRRQKLDPEMADEVMPKNILMIGPTGVGKTELARRLAKLSNAPFLKVEASKFTEVGYVGRDVESIVRDITEYAVNMLKEEKNAEVLEKATRMAEERILDVLVPPLKRRQTVEALVPPEELPEGDDSKATREKFREKLHAGELENRMIEVDVTASQLPSMQILGPINIEEMGMNIQEMFGNMMPKRTKKRKMTVAEARVIVIQEESQKLIDTDLMVKEALDRVENTGIVFIDEIDKIAGPKSQSAGPDVSREGVQRDLLPIVEGTSVTTKYGIVKTDHILFIASGAFHIAKPSDLIPELQGRFPIRVELDPLTRDDFVRILTEPRNALITQYVELLKTEQVTLRFAPEAVEAIAEIAMQVNTSTENIGARRLYTVMEKLLEQISFDAPDLPGKELTIDAAYVHDRLSDITRDQDLSRFIL